MEPESTSVINSCSKDRYLLTRSYAAERSQLITGLSYKLCFYLDSEADNYHVDTVITFELANLSNIILECGTHSIQYFSINNTISLPLVVIANIWRDNALYIPSDYLREGTNILCFKTTSNFSRDSSGFHSYVHNTGGSRLCYTVCPPNYAHLIYPCFDQPDIKATFDLKVRAPQEWIVISNSPSIENKEQALDEGYKWWFFNKTPRISTYLFSVAAGNFMEIKPKKTTQVPMRLYCSDYKYSFLLNQAEEFFFLVEAGITYYSKFFGMSFPFEKYDQVFCPEFKYLGMENPGMVCITENYIFMTQISAFKKSQRALTILHELSHMWFGDFVTMKWWDDIWLNEGFASFISYHVLPIISQDPLAHTIDIKFLFYKQEALNMDDLDSTHPVMQDVKDTEAATNIFDDITYCKGSAVIKHLMYMIGEENFSKALASYFQRFGWNNANSKDFLGVIEEIMELSAGPNNLSIQNGHKENHLINRWVYDWLETEGKLNIFYEISLSNTGIMVDVTKEVLPSRVTTSKHVDLEVAVFALEPGNKVGKIGSQRVSLIEDKMRMEIVLPKFDAKEIGVVLNYKDNAYSEIIMDDLSIQFFLKHSKKIEPLIKAQLFMSMVKRIQLAQMNPVELFKWIEEEINEEKIPYLSSEYLIYATKLIDNYLPEKIKAKCGKILFTKLYSILTAYNNTMDPNKEELVITIQEHIANFAYFNEDVQLLVKWMQKKNPALNKVNLSGVLMGRIIEELFLRKILTDSERDNIRSVYIRNHPYYVNFANGASSNLESKINLWAKFVNFKPSDGSHFEFSCLMKGVNNPHDANIGVLANKFFDDLLTVFENNENEYSNIFFTNLFPKFYNSDFIIEKIEIIMEKIQFTESYANLKNLLEEKLNYAKVCKSLEKFC